MESKMIFMSIPQRRNQALTPLLKFLNFLKRVKIDWGNLLWLLGTESEGVSNLHLQRKA